MSVTALNKYNMIKDSWNKDYEEAAAKGKRIRTSKLHPSGVYKHPPQPGTTRWSVQWQKLKREVEKESERVSALIELGKASS